ncbi:MAG: Asp-tRNA(Asn)/Glu-tRNA(Gln) amidotransferase subunit GatC [Firmicutes bacterium]|nr:Asp-tRNA(Asn)/Glu-tRNA(Gln) amidotransferase subunit GatC [Bacillota bacterium]
MDKKTLIEFEKITKLELSENEREEFLTKINDSLKSFDKLLNIDTDNLEPLICVLESQKNILREDKAQKNFERNELLKGARDADDGYFIVPKTIE